jgi:hypothetical protein
VSFPTLRTAPAVVVVVFVVTRLLFQPVSMAVSTFSFRGDLAARAAATLNGRSFDVSTLGNCMPILDRELLLHDLGRSLWYLHSQPPLFNLFVAGMLRLPGDFARNMQWANWLTALALYLIALELMRRCGVRDSIAAMAVILFMINPNAMWMENAVYYGVLLALMLALSALCFSNALKRRSLGWFAAAAILVALLPLTRAFFTAIWSALALALMAFALDAERRRQAPAAPSGSRRRAIVATALLPFVLVVAFQVKQYLVFGQALGSSWFGCNLAAMTGGMKSEKVHDLAMGKVSPLVEVYRNDPPETYMRYFHVATTGIPVLDATRKSTGQPNFNHAIYIPVGRQYLRDTLYLIVHHPHKYLMNVVNSIYILSGFQIGVYFDYPARFFARWTWIDIAAPFLGFPLIVIALITAWRRLRALQDGEERHLLAYMLFNAFYVLGVSAFLEKSEGAVYRYQVDAFLWTFLGMALSATLPAVVARYRLREVITSAVTPGPRT